MGAATLDLFQSTLSVRRATRDEVGVPAGEDISIHALRKESDWIGTPSARLAEIFQSTLSVRRATAISPIVERPVGISIHALRKESDHYADALADKENISIHALRKESDTRLPARSPRSRISIHALRKETDRAAGHFCPLSETQASCLALSISNNTTGTTNNMPKTSSCLSVSF